MTVIVSGEACVQLPNGSKRAIAAGDLRFEHIATLNSNPPEDTHEAVWLAHENENGPGVAWKVWEKPKGVFNDSSSEPFNGAKIISDFELSIELDCEEKA